MTQILIGVPQSLHYLDHPGIVLSALKHFLSGFKIHKGHHTIYQFVQSGFLEY